MLVKDLIALLQQQDQELEVVIDMFSDYDLLNDDCIQVGRAVPTDVCIMRSHKTMSEANKLKEKTYLYIGNWGLGGEY